MHAIVADERTQVMGRQVHPATVAAAQQDPIGPAAVDGLQAFPDRAISMMRLGMEPPA